MSIIKVVAGNTGFPELFPFFEGSRVAGRTDQAVMFPFQGEIRLLVVLERPEVPTIRVVTVVAIAAQRFFMGIFFTMTRITTYFCVLVRRGKVTLFAGNGAVLTN